MTAPGPSPISPATEAQLTQAVQASQQAEQRRQMALAQQRAIEQARAQAQRRIDPWALIDNLIATKHPIMNASDDETVPPPVKRALLGVVSALAVLDTEATTFKLAELDKPREPSPGSNRDPVERSETEASRPETPNGRSVPVQGPPALRAVPATSGT